MVEQKVIPTDLTAARRLAEEILGQVEAHGYSQEVCFAIRLAVEEALINAIRHGNRYDRKKSITVSADVGSDQTAITIADQGTGFDPAVVPDPTVDENLEKPCGRGIMLMRAYMDEVAFNQRGNVVRLVKHRSAGTP
jgi:serine/threonine-protein kinase RsbW